MTGGEIADVRLREIYSPKEVRGRIDALVDRLYRDYADSPLTVVVITDGARAFAQSLVEGLRTRQVSPELMEVRAWRTRGTALGEVQIEAIDPSLFLDLDVLVVDDIADEGKTLEAVLSLIEEGEPRSVRVAVLVSKHAGRKVPVPLDYVGFDVEDGWVVGFGMDLDGRFRDLEGLSIAETAESS
jgi:hypoxanthine phosphoribosyltransferase